MPVWSNATLKALLVPGGILLLGILLLLYSGWLTLPLQALSFLYYCALIGGWLLAWRFHSSRTFFALLVLSLATQGIAFVARPFSPGTAGWITLQAVAVLVPLNFVLIAQMHERGLTLSGTAPVALFLFVQAVIVAVLSQASGAPSLPPRAHPVAAPLPPYAIPAFVIAGVSLLVRFLFTRKPIDSALLWSLSAFFLSVRYAGNLRFSTVYSATAASILVASIMENSYLLAYHDELTTLPSRRSFNDTLMRLQPPYAIAVADIDHFKKFNDTYGHDTGDQVLKLVAAGLSRVTGGGQAFRCGGEEFSILFPGKTTDDVLGHLEKLRASIESSEFRLRGGDRRRAARGPDRRQPLARGREQKGRAIRQLAQEKPTIASSVTVSIGVAMSSTQLPRPDLVLQAADKALYRAKANGRNRVEIAPSIRKKARTKAAGIA